MDVIRQSLLKSQRLTDAERDRLMEPVRTDIEDADKPLIPIIVTEPTQTADAIPILITESMQKLAADLFRRLGRDKVRELIIALEDLWVNSDVEAAPVRETIN